MSTLRTCKGHHIQLGARPHARRLRHHDVHTAILPEVHTCTHELHLPPYNSSEQLLDRLLLALDHRDDGFQNH